MIRTTTLKTAVAACLALALLVKLKVDDARVASARDRAATSALALTNTAAERDSTRDVAATNRRIATLLGDSLRLVEKHSLQATQRADALDRALNDERIERATIRTTIDSLSRTAVAAPSPPVDAAMPAIADSAHALRRARFEIRQAPYTIVAEAEIPPPPDSATIAMHVALDAIPLDVRLECSAPNGQGIRAGSITASAPRWANVRLDHVEQSPDLCASPALIQSARRTHSRFIPLILGIGATVATHGASGWGLFLGAGIAL
jgi:hypothetical protein